MFTETIDVTNVTVTTTITVNSMISLARKLTASLLPARHFPNARRPHESRSSYGSPDSAGAHQERKPQEPGANSPAATSRHRRVPARYLRFECAATVRDQECCRNPRAP